MTMSSNDGYVFTRDYLDNNRINLMHSLWTKVFGYAVHPRIPIAKPDLHVADVGTGTGIWLFDVREHLAKSAQLVGLDISLNAAPHPDTLPSNVKLRHWDIKDDLPADLVAAFDLVHVRFLSFVLLNNEVEVVLRKLFQMLSTYICTNSTSRCRLVANPTSEPGGYLQWGEPDMETLRIDKVALEAKSEGLEQLFKLFEIQDARLKPTWAVELHNLFSAVGFDHVDVHSVDCPPHWAYIFHEGGLMMHEIISRKNKSEKLQHELARLLPQAVEETRNGAWVSCVRLTVIGKRPAQ
ncbi:UMTA methyltransferase family protein [Metarhizium robertsii ARSEF 23]|uniref:UMTA methyltransferase family protein n=1 Tax=Metarhizium robertsii (strain ARSEF 23 / ATCC MYA-3075) TaxID=655844 RepID=E9FD42_METRA|nr:UMTA methyltransferase family protein [Metarhizium robertsii ARSEF 23]EFY94347.2 UMTA methyltransferase family protein [Metarhizium robertsii ARSEF 23]